MFLGYIYRIKELNYIEEMNDNLNKQLETERQIVLSKQESILNSYFYLIT